MNNSIFESIFAVFDDKPPFLSILDTFWPIFGHFSYSTSINHSLTIELNNILNWITRVYFELNNILNWILGKAILNRILNESFFGKIQILNCIRLGIVHHYLPPRSLQSFNTSLRDLFKTSVFLLNSRIAQPTSLDVDCLLMSSVSFKKTASPPSRCKKLGVNISSGTSDHILKITRTTDLLWNISQQCTFATIFKIDTADKFWL